MKLIESKCGQTKDMFYLLSNEGMRYEVDERVSNKCFHHLQNQHQHHHPHHQDHHNHLPILLPLISIICSVFTHILLTIMQEHPDNVTPFCPVPRSHTNVKTLFSLFDPVGAPVKEEGKPCIRQSALNNYTLDKWFGNIQCGGPLVAGNWVLTPAHCIRFQL